MKISCKPRSLTQAGFSLVEVALAVAIASLAIITLLGLLPQGLDMSRKTLLLVNDSNILEQVSRDLDSSLFTMLPVANTKRYFNDQGREVQQGATDLAFVVQIEPQVLVSMPKTETTQPYLKRMIIRIAATNSASFVFSNANTLSYSTFNQLIVKTR
jgi:uncharacterized protein (TIGR02598 family)